MNWTEYVIDGTIDVVGGMFCFCPVNEDSYMTGMNYISDRPPDGTVLVGVIHLDGQEAADAFYEKHKSAITTIISRGMAQRLLQTGTNDA